MENITTRTTAQSPSRFRMPACAHASLVSATSGRVLGGDVRDLGAVIAPTGQDVKGFVGFAYIPGTSAWRPPTC